MKTFERASRIAFAFAAVVATVATLELGIVLPANTTEPAAGLPAIATVLHLASPHAS